MAYHEAGTQSETAGWKDAYWRISGTEILIHLENGEEVNFRKVKDIGMMLNVTCCDDWEQVMEG